MTRLGRHTPIVAFAVLAVASGALGETADGWRADVPCGEGLASPVDTPLADCASSYCISLPDSRVCSCLNSSGDDSLEFVWKRNESTQSKWKVKLYSPPDAAAFHVDRVNLGSPPEEAFLVAARTGVSNGMGVAYWSVRAIAGAAVSNEVLVEDYGLLGFPTHPTKDAECQLLVTRWLWAKDPMRGDGLYLYGRWFRLREGSLKTDPTRPLVARRYLYRFERERLSALSEATSQPLTWFRSATANPPICRDPFCQ